LAVVREFLFALRHYADLSGRASRREFWRFMLWYLILTIMLVVADATLGRDGRFGLADMAYVALFVPQLALQVRRLHDVGLSGYQVKYSLIVGLSGLSLVVAGGSAQIMALAYLGVGVVAAAFALIIFIWVCMLMPGSKGLNEYGPMPSRR
jgi:uncharacterized membrane protein YhaH (DUF805 family)